jgi:fatty acid desaturase
MASTMNSFAPVVGRGQGSDFVELCRAVKQASLLRRRRGYYIVKGTLGIVVLAAAWIVFGYLGDSWWQLFTAALLAGVFTQLSFIGHDAGHKQIFRGRQANDVMGLVHGGLVGLSYGWWIGKHNRHHANPNHEDHDPDLDIPALAFTIGQGRTKRGVLRWMAKYQAFLFFPLLLLEGLILHWASIQTMWRDEVKSRRREKFLLITHIGVYLTMVFFVLSPAIAVVFIAVHQGLWGVYMGCSFAPNHKGMPTVTDDDSLDFLRKQVLTRAMFGVGRGRTSRWVG